MLKSKKINLQSLKKILVERGFVVKKKKNNFTTGAIKIELMPHTILT